MDLSNDITTKTCLLVDDDDDDKEIFCIALEKVDPFIKFKGASDGLEALSILKDQSFVPDYIFLDLNMPRMDGKECLKELRKLPHLTKTPIIIFTTSTSQKDKDETARLGATAFITKPPLVDSLAQKLAGIFSGQLL